MYYAIMNNKNLSPHDRMFRSLMSNKAVATEFFTKHLPIDIKKQVQLNSLKLQKNSYVGDNLRMQITDLLFSADFKGQDGYIYLLVEHQSKPEKLMPFRVLKYMIAIMEDHLKRTGETSLPIVYPMIMYSGKSKYNYSTNLFDLFETRKELALQIFCNAYELINISKIPAEEFNQFLWYGTLAQAMKSVHEYSDINQMLKCVIPKLSIIAKFGNFSYISTIVTYFFETGEMRDQKEFNEIMKRNFTKKETRKIMTYAEQLRFEGRAEGILAGREQGVLVGKTETARSIAIKLLQRESEPVTIASITELPLAQILDLKKKIKSRKG